MEIMDEGKSILPTILFATNDGKNKKCGCKDRCCCISLCSKEDREKCEKEQDN